MIIKTVIEDDIAGEGLTAEHGLCIYVETANHKLFVDSGQSEKTWENARKMGIDIENADTLILSHGHYDHSGGIKTFMRQNSKALIYISENAAGEFYSKKSDGMRYIGIDRDILKSERIHLVKGDVSLDSELDIFRSVLGREFWPAGNSLLFEKSEDEYIPDTFEHEQYLVIKEGEKHVLISGCAHRGILNILERFKELYNCDPTMVISGFHTILKQYDEASIECFKQLAAKLNEKDTLFYTGHCTDKIPFSVMQEVMGEKLRHLTDLCYNALL